MSIGTVTAVACVLRLSLGDATSYEASATTIARGRTAAATTGVLGEMEVDPQLALRWTDRGAHVALAYAPQFLVQERSGQDLQTVHRALLTAGWLLDGRWRAAVAATGSYGTTDILLTTVSALGSPLEVTQSTVGQTSSTDTSLPPPSTPSGPSSGTTEPSASMPSQSGGANSSTTGTSSTQPIQPIPGVTTLRYLSAEATMTLIGTPLPGIRLITMVSGSVSGGADAASQNYLPLQRGAGVTTALEWNASASDLLVSTGAATLTFFDAGMVDGYALIRETWRRTLNPHAQVRAGLGPALLAHRDAGKTNWSFGASGELGIRGRVATTVELDFGVTVTPIVDRVSGAVYSRADATGLAAWRPAPRWAVVVSGTGGVVLQGAQSGDQIAAADLRAIWSLVPECDLSAGLLGIFQFPHAASASRISEAMAFVGVTFRTLSRPL